MHPIDIIFEEIRRRRAVETDHQAAVFVVAVGIEAVPSPTVIGLVGVYAEPRENRARVFGVLDDPLCGANISRGGRLFDNITGVTAGRPGA